MNKKDFKKYMQQGLGRCILVLQSSENIEKSAILCPAKTEVADFVSFKGSIVQGITLCNKYQYNNLHKFDYL